MRVDVWMAQIELDERRDLLGCRHRANEQPRYNRSSALVIV